jgi:hypothetical protein
MKGIEKTKVRRSDVKEGLFVVVGQKYGPLEPAIVAAGPHPARSVNVRLYRGFTVRRWGRDLVYDIDNERLLSPEDKPVKLAQVWAADPDDVRADLSNRVGRRLSSAPHLRDMYKLKSLSSDHLARVASEMGVRVGFNLVTIDEQKEVTLSFPLEPTAEWAEKLRAVIEETRLVEPENHGEPWTPEHYRQLRGLLAAGGLSHADIGAMMGRSPKAITTKIVELRLEDRRAEQEVQHGNEEEGSGEGSK